MDRNGLDIHQIYEYMEPNCCAVFEQTAQAQNAKGSREVLLNCQYFYCFPKNNFRAFNNLATLYLGLDKKQIEKMKNLKSRYVMINKNYPSFYVSSVECGML